MAKRISQARLLLLFAALPLVAVVAHSASAAIQPGRRVGHRFGTHGEARRQLPIVPSPLPSARTARSPDTAAAGQSRLRRVRARRASICAAPSTANNRPSMSGPTQRSLQRSRGRCRRRAEPRRPSRTTASGMPATRLTSSAACRHANEGRRCTRHPSLAVVMTAVAIARRPASTTRRARAELVDLHGRRARTTGVVSGRSRQLIPATGATSDRRLGRRAVRTARSVEHAVARSARELGLGRNCVIPRRAAERQLRSAEQTRDRSATGRGDRDRAPRESRQRGADHEPRRGVHHVQRMRRRFGAINRIVQRGNVQVRGG